MVEEKEGISFVMYDQQQSSSRSRKTTFKQHAVFGKYCFLSGNTMDMNSRDGD